jgi:hypothetical protein
MRGTWTGTGSCCSTDFTIRHTSQTQPWEEFGSGGRGTTIQQPQYTPQYVTEVNKGSVNMRSLTNHLNEMGQQGWRLHSIFEQDKNTVIVFERMMQTA